MRENSSRPWLPVLCYHSITPELTNWDYTITPSVFESQLKFLKRNGYKSLSLSNLLDIFEGKAELPPHSVAITFDDGYLDNYIYAWPLLEKYGFTASIFLVSDFIGKDNSFDLFRAAHLKTMSRQHILEMAQAGIEFGSHTATHKPLPSLTTMERHQELTRSRAELSALLGKEVKFFAYPNSRLNKECELAVAKAGYKLAFSGAGPHFSPYNINRIELFKSGSIKMSLKIKTGKYSRNLRKSSVYMKIRKWLAIS